MVTDPHLPAIHLSSPATIVELLRARASQNSDCIGYTFLYNGETEQGRFTYRALDLRARAIGAWLSAMLKGGPFGQRGLLLYPQSLEFIAAFYGCLYGGVTAVPAYPLDINRLDRTLSRLRVLLHDAQPFVALTTSDSLALIDELKRDHGYLKHIRWIASDTIPDDMSENWKYPSVTSETLAFLQYTSGSTAAPKGVMVSHHNVLENVRMLKVAPGYSENPTGVSWVPMAHDMGLVGRILLPLYLGAHSIFMSPEAFVQKPVRWLRAISKYKAGVSAGPNFAYELCVRRVTAEERETLDLKSWVAAIISAEPVRADTIDRFSAAFAPCGFRREAFRSDYGLAEATVHVASSRNPLMLRVDKRALEQHKIVPAPPDGQASACLVSCGRPSAGKVVIVDPDTNRSCAENKVGEIWISGGHIAQGYWNKAGESDLIFQARLADTDEGPFLRTGDLGFIHNSELFVTGRRKDLMIVRGRNHYPQDIELTVEKCHKALRPGAICAFSVDSAAGESVVLVQELKDSQPSDWREIIEMIRQSVFREHEILVHSVVLVKARSMKKTSSGKLQRQACRAAFMENKLSVVNMSRLEDQTESSTRPCFIAPCTLTEKKLAAIWSEVLAADRIGLLDNFLNLGGESMLAQQCINRVAQILGVELPPGILFSESSNVREMARTIDAILNHTPEGIVAVGNGLKDVSV